MDQASDALSQSGSAHGTPTVTQSVAEQLRQAQQPSNGNGIGAGASHGILPGFDGLSSGDGNTTPMHEAFGYSTIQLEDGSAQTTESLPNIDPDESSRLCARPQREGTCVRWACRWLSDRGDTRDA